METERGDAIEEHAARVRIGFKQGNIIVETRQGASGSHTSRATADDGCLAGLLRAHVERRKATIEGAVGDEPFQLADFHMLSLLTEDATSFALDFTGADTAANGRYITLFIDDVHGIADVALGQGMDKGRDFIADGTALAALRHLAIEAPFSFCNGFR